MMGSDAGVLPKCFRHLNHISGDIVETDIASGDNPAEGGLSGGSSGSDCPPGALIHTSSNKHISARKSVLAFVME